MCTMPCIMHLDELYWAGRLPVCIPMNPTPCSHAHVIQSKQLIPLLPAPQISHMTPPAGAGGAAGTAGGTGGPTRADVLFGRSHRMRASVVTIASITARHGDSLASGWNQVRLLAVPGAWGSLKGIGLGGALLPGGSGGGAAAGTQVWRSSPIPCLTPSPCHLTQVMELVVVLYRLGILPDASFTRALNGDGEVGFLCRGERRGCGVG